MVFVAVNTPIILPWPLRSGLQATVRALLEPGDRPPIDFSKPISEPALVSPESVSWRVFKNPLSLFIGGITAVIMELAEPRVRTGVWEHTTFRLNPIKRLRRTGLAAMVTIYGARSTAEAMIASVRRVHVRIKGTTPSGEPCSDPSERSACNKWYRGRTSAADRAMVPEIAARKDIIKARRSSSRGTPRASFGNIGHAWGLGRAMREFDGGALLVQETGGR